MNNAQYATSRRQTDCRAFTLVELMVVVAVVAILIGAVFQLINVVGQMNQKAVTISRLQRIQNAISGFYAAYGYYPPVPTYQSSDPWVDRAEDDFGGSIPPPGTESGLAARAAMAASCQPVAFEFPPITALDDYINRVFREWQILSPNTVLAPYLANTQEEDWSEIKAFKFGLLSFLLPRVELVGFTGAENNPKQEPNQSFYESRQWKKHNPSSDVGEWRKVLMAQQELENRTVARWLPNLEKIVAHGRTILGVDLREPDTDSEAFRVKDVWQNGKLVDKLAYKESSQKYVLQYVTLRDGWGRELYYYSPPPYQSYRLWSAGANGKTFPPWIKVEHLNSQERKWVSDWIADDIVKFDQ